MSTRTPGRHRAASHHRRMATFVAAGSAPVVVAMSVAGVASAGPLPHDSASIPSITSFVAPYASTSQIATDRSVQPAVVEQAPLGPLEAHYTQVPVAAVKPVMPPRPATVRAGDLVLPAPDWLSTQQTQEINGAAAGAEAQVASTGEAMGLDPARAHQVAADTVGDSVRGAAIATVTVGAPLAAAGGLVGGVAGLIAGVPFLPIGLAIGPVLGAAIGAAVTAAPVTAIGAGIGAGVGVVRGLAEPPHR